MEFSALNGQEITKIETIENGIVISVEIQEIEANIEITGIETMKIDGDVTKTITSLVGKEIENVEIDVIDFDEDTFSTVVLWTEEGIIYSLEGDMKGTILNIEDFQDLIDDMISQNDFEDEDFDEED